MKFDTVTFVGGIVAGVCLVFAIWAAIDLNILDGQYVCDIREPRLVCARNWANAIAIVAAAGTIYFLFRQLREQSKQTSFVIGDADPTFDAFSDDFVTTYFRVTNWNRRAFVVSHIECVETTAVVIDRVRLLHRPVDEVMLNNSPRFSPEIRISAYVDRSKGPKECFIYASVFGQSGPNMGLFTFKLHGRLLGDEHRHLTLTARAKIETF